MEKVDRITQLVAAQVAGGYLGGFTTWEDVIWRAVAVNKAIERCAQSKPVTMEEIKKLANEYAPRASFLAAEKAIKGSGKL